MRLAKLRKQWSYHLLLLPGVILVFIFSYIPLYGLVIAFQKYNPGMGFASPWLGMNNFIYVFNQPNFVRTIWNTFYIAFFKLIGGVIIPVGVALLLNELKSSKIKRIFQTMVYLPNFLSWVIMAGILMDVLATDGIINRVLNLMGLNSINFLGNVKIFPWSMIVSDIWKGFGFGTVVYLAALTGIDPGLYESAMIDGAKRWNQTVYITFPLLMPTIILMIVLALGSILNAGFDQIYNLYSPVVFESGDIIDTYVYRLGLQQAQFSVGAAVGMFKSLVSCVMVILSYTLADKVAGYRIF